MAPRRCGDHSVLAIGRRGVVDIAAVIDFCRARRAERLAHLRRRRGAARGDRKILAVAAAHAKGGAGACDTRRSRRRRHRIVAIGICKETGLRRGLADLLLDAAEKHVEQAFGDGRIRHGQHGAGKDGGSQQRPAPQGPKSQLGTQRLLHPTQHNTTGRGTNTPSARIHHNRGW